MTTRMLINATVADELRIAIVEDGELTELDIETTDQNQIRGNIYKGVVHNVEQSLAAAFVDIGGHKQGFLPFDEIDPAVYGSKRKDSENTRITDVVKRGQEIVVQVMKDAVGEKGATLTTHLSIPGRYTVLMPGSDANGVSRKIDDEVARKRIRAIAAKIEKPEDCGFIVRTAGFGQTRLAIQKDLTNVVAIWEKVQRSAQIARAPSLLYAEPDLISRTLRDFFNEEIEEVWIDSREEYEAAKKYFEELMPQFVERIQWYQNPIPIFAYYHVEEQIEATFHRNVALPSGGSIVIDETEALVAIDVNSGKMTSEKGHEDTVFKTNVEAALEAARQLKLRDLGGIIVIDFIDMELRKNERAVEKALVEAAKLDKARYKISKINAQGLCVLTRQRIRQGMRRAFQRRCNVCSGTGWIRTPESHSLSLLRRVETRLAQGGVGEVRVSTHRETAEYILNYKRSELMALEREYHCRILVIAKLEMDRNSDDVAYLSKGEMLAEITDRLPPREERRELRMLRRRKKKKKLAAMPIEEGEEPAAEEQPRGDRSERKKKRRRERERERDRERAASAGTAVVPAGEGAVPAEGAVVAGAETSEVPAAAVGEQQQVAGERSERRERRERRERERDRDRGRERRPPAEPGRFDGSGVPSFTGRPPPEVLERLKAERKARLNASLNARPGAVRSPSAPTAQAMDQTSQPPMAADSAGAFEATCAPEPPAIAEDAQGSREAAYVPESRAMSEDAQATAAPGLASWETPVVPESDSELRYARADRDERDERDEARASQRQDADRDRPSFERRERDEAREASQSRDADRDRASFERRERDEARDAREPQAGARTQHAYADAEPHRRPRAEGERETSADDDTPRSRRASEDESAPEARRSRRPRRADAEAPAEPAPSWVEVPHDLPREAYSYEDPVRAASMREVTMSEAGSTPPPTDREPAAANASPEAPADGERARKPGLLERLGVLRHMEPPVPPPDGDV